MEEKQIEKRLRVGVKEMGGMAIKFFSPWFTGMPDRMVLMPRGRIWFVEMKTPGAKPRPRQGYVMKLLERLGFKVLVIDTDEKVKEFLNHIKNWIMMGSTYQARINDNGIYTSQGDHVAMFEDDSIRNDVVDFLNGENDNQELLEFLEDKDLDLQKLEELIGKQEDQEEKLEKISNELDEVKDGLQELMDRIQLDNLQQDDWDVLYGLHEKVKSLAA